MQNDNEYKSMMSDLEKAWQAARSKYEGT
jgi:hypothetical protein